MGFEKWLYDRLTQGHMIDLIFKAMFKNTFIFVDSEIHINFLLF